MIIKRTGKFQMLPSLKRCRLSASSLKHDDDDDDDDSDVKAKRRKLNGQFPLYLLGQIAAGVIVCHSSNPPTSLLQSKSEKHKSVKFNGRELSKGKKSRPVEEVSKPPLVRTSRGRVQVLPSKFNDSVLDNWKKDTKPELDECTVSGDANDSDWGRKGIGHKPSKLQGSNGNTKSDKYSYQSRYMYDRKSLTYDQEEEEDDEEEEEMPGTTRFGKYKNSVKTSRGRLVKEETSWQFEAPVHGNDKRKATGLTGVGEFIAGDIVWAKSGQGYPFWPALVIDPLTQAPQQVLNYNIPGAYCLMFFGYSGNGKQRVR